MPMILLKIHRWVALIFAMPLLAVIGTGLVLSIEPLVVTASMSPGKLTPANIDAVLAQHDPDGRARSITYRSYDGTLSLAAGRGPGKTTIVDVATNRTLAGPGPLASVLQTARRMHETLLIQAGWLVTLSSAAMLLLAVLGILMGPPRRFVSSLSGWHKGTAWVLLPLVVLSPLTGLLMAFGISFTSPLSAPASARQTMTLRDAVRLVGKDHDVSGLVTIREQRGLLIARIVEAGEYRLYAVAPNGLTAMPRNWPRLWHEGNFAGAISALLNLVTAFALMALLATGFMIWLARQLRRRNRRRAAAAA